jgi:hypothetical protein
MTKRIKQTLITGILPQLRKVSGLAEHKKNEMKMEKSWGK